MKVVKKSLENAPVVSRLIMEGEIVCCPTDTLYGLLGSATNEKAVEKVYSIKGREREKPLIVLFKDLNQAQELGVLIDDNLREKLERVYPAPLTVILPLKEDSPFRKVFKRDNLGIRIPKDDFLLKVIELSTPLFAPSANPSGKEPAENCKECRIYFEGRIPLCVEGKASGKPSTLVSLVGKELKVLREGSFPKEKLLEVLNG
ncbi:L-threonylcarbamoyladenylate synthase [Thermovibrio guaymasensis]|uniref:L-threonylcarbamoyladenylate synthase n=1 Tax=Thermovibrio guaymasensis TaxID=240167 RepID=A0A420W7S2_9BACT|nr:L-threonylcarbamoyladenylate synthase [Thermovibrio guaymasensis]RKQ63325.1 L-threonylcarbamoyladenylate synthase [Thermovibrio guaymasensis]